jgi:cobalt-zinc-cadmium efflux system outer membrane protein
MHDGSHKNPKIQHRFRSVRQVPMCRSTVSRALGAALLSAALAGCALYHARPLPEQTDLATKLAPLQVDVSKMQLPGLKPHGFDPVQGLDMTDAAILAVLNNPGLRTARSEAGAARAQAFAAGLLPGPELSASRDVPSGNGNTPGLVTGRSVGIGYQLSSLFTRGAEQAAAEAGAKQADLQLLWDEWQVAQEARVLFVQCRMDQDKNALLGKLEQAMSERYAATQQALARGDVALDTVGTDLATLGDVQSRASAAARDRNIACRSLNELLGLAPEVQLQLLAPDAPMDVTQEEISTALAKLPQRRPDLVALQFGYAAEDAQVRRAVRAQFPAITLGVNRANDTSDIRTHGLDLTLGFPFLFGGADTVHAEEASRDALWQAYQQRLDESASEVQQLAADLALLKTRLASLQTSAGDAEQIAQSADAAYARGDLAAPAYYDLTISALNRRLDTLDAQAEALDLHIALETLLGLPPEDLRHPIDEAQP